MKHTLKMKLLQKKNEFTCTSLCSFYAEPFALTVATYCGCQVARVKYIVGFNSDRPDAVLDQIRNVTSILVRNMH